MLKTELFVLSKSGIIHLVSHLIKLLNNLLTIYFLGKKLTSANALEKYCCFCLVTIIAAVQYKMHFYVSFCFLFSSIRCQKEYINC